MQLRDYQIKLKDQTYAAWNAGHPNVLAVMPTGAGKTKTFCSIASDFIKGTPPQPTVILVHRKELVQQIALTLAEEGIIHNIIAQKKTIKQIVAGEFKLYRKSFYNSKADVTVISVDTLNARASKYASWAKSIRLWICDEAAHLVVGNKWSRAIEWFPNARGLGVTATPKRLDRKGLGRHADGVFDVMVEGPSVKELMDRGFLSSYRAVVPESTFKQYLGRAAAGHDFTHDQMQQAAEKSKIVGDVVFNYKKFSLHKQAIVFSPTISIANQTCEEFLANGIAAIVLTGNSEDDERLEGMVAFRDRRVQALINVDLFDEGLDVPGIETVIMQRPTESFGKFRQMIGRGLRPAPGKEFALIIDHVGNFERHGMPHDPVTWSLDAPGRRKPLQLLRICRNPMCSSPFHRAEKVCPYCGTSATDPAAGGGGGGERVPPEMVDGDLTLIDPFTLQEIKRATILEDPADVSTRVSRAAGTAAGISAMKKQIKRHAVQKRLSDTIAHWAGQQAARGLGNNEIHKLFFTEHRATIDQALALEARHMEDLISHLEKSDAEAKG